MVLVVQRILNISCVKIILRALCTNCLNLILCIPDFLEFIRSHFIREQTNVEIRLKAIFVGADTDGDGNMDIDEFNAMIAITQSSLSHQQLLRMYSEMTLNSRVDCDVFVRVARVFRFCAFEVGPVCGPSLSRLSLWLLIIFAVREKILVCSGSGNVGPAG